MHAMNRYLQADRTNSKSLLASELLVFEGSCNENVKYKHFH